VAYGTDTRKVERILMNIAREHDMVLMNPAPGVDFMGFGADSLDFRIRAVLRDINYGVSVRTEMRHQIIERFAKEGIEIPFGQRDVWLRNPEVLAEALAAVKPSPKEVAEPRISRGRPPERVPDDGGEDA
jgi:small-conductance mechanosensitive channel